MLEGVRSYYIRKCKQGERSNTDENILDKLTDSVTQWIGFTDTNRVPRDESLDSDMFGHRDKRQAMMKVLAVWSCFSSGATASHLQDSVFLSIDAVRLLF